MKILSSGLDATPSRRHLAKDNVNYLYRKTYRFAPTANRDHSLRRAATCRTLDATPSTIM